MDKNLSIASKRLASSPTRFASLCRALRKLLICTILACALLAGSPALAQRSRRTRTAAIEPLPPHAQAASRHTPLLLAFALLGLAWFPAFKNAKRDLSP